MHLNPDRIGTLAQRIADRELTDRHRRRTRQEYETIFGVSPTPEAEDVDLDLIFRRVIQERATPLNPSQYHDILDGISPQAILEKDTHQAAFDALRSQSQIGQKIANEFLRQAVDVFGIRRSEWLDQLEVPLDTNVVLGLVKTGGIVLEDSEREPIPDRIVNMNPEADPRILIGYQEVQNAFEMAANEAGFPRIVFDELWLEHRRFLSDPLLQTRSAFSDLIQDPYLYDSERA